MDQLLQHVLNAVVLGGTYALLGIGLTLIFGVMKVANFTHGELYTFGAYMAYLLIGPLGLNFFLGLLIAVLLGVLLGAVIEYVLLRPLQGAHMDTVMLVMIGAWIALQNLELLTWGGVAKSVPQPFPTEPLVIGSVSVAPLRIFVLLAALVLLAVFYLILNRTKFGIAIRATFQDPDVSSLMGVKINQMFTLTFAIGSGLAAAAGALLAPVFVVIPIMGDLVTLKAFAVVILGGLGNIVGATIGGFILALAEEFGAGYIDSGYRDAIGFILIILVLLLKPQGLFAPRERTG
ncbi:branched-chain amino acid ABC transporter permease [Bradyrhizobium sp. JYMT SZCCT0428]|uniref:branched-chain amino acid ABC transporter permease n=1 Tax=Bradyrhizobium sp. JYMT SZCCT0428 TaxID=2807673 RepID=UPI001BA937C8|nr:branched-chain amino acid ABC transporter permease [Bradyrhizobium sp. JYMT SZCCT0428]MBR1154067.1 branched-chain amino acid ABC transporter permease [Bradyrhizobium sp. JYMT SZCCT0428]